MKTAEIVETSQGQPVRIPDEFRFNAKSVSIRREGDALQLAVKEWRVRFTVANRAVRVIDIRSGYGNAQRRAAQPGTALPEAHRDFAAHFPSP